jgi:hypothetical protein
MKNLVSVFTISVMWSWIEYRADRISFSMSTSDAPSPLGLWNRLSESDKTEYMHIQTAFKNAPKITSRDRRVHTFPRDLGIVINFIESSNENSDIRAILVGLCFVGPVVCINTQRLKEFTNRCKSAVNGSFQELGYIAFRSKSKARECVLTSLPALRPFPAIIRQWTARAVSAEAHQCFLSSFSAENLPEIRADDLLTEKKTREKKRKPQVEHSRDIPFQFPTTADEMTPQIMFDFPTNWLAEDPLHVLEPDWAHVPLIPLEPLPELNVTSCTWFDEILSDCP